MEKVIEIRTTEAKFFENTIEQLVSEGWNVVSSKCGQMTDENFRFDFAYEARLILPDIEEEE